MTLVGKGTQARGSHNEDFCYAAHLEEARLHVLVVGDFASSEYKGLEELASDELKGLVKALPVASAPPDVLLTSLAVQFNNRLLTLKKFKDTSYQCCAAFAAIKEGALYYLTVGDCRVSVWRDGNLMLLNGSVWEDAAGGPLPSLVTPQQEVKRGYEPPPDFVLGAGEVSVLPAQVNEFRLQANDAVLLYSDGVDKILSPSQVLSLISEGVGTASPEAIAANVLREVGTQQGDDDRTVVIALGPHEQAGEETLKSAVVPIRNEQSKLAAEQDRQAALLNTLIEQQREYRTLVGDVQQSLSSLLARPKSSDETLKYAKAAHETIVSVAEALRGIPSIANIERAVNAARKEQSDDRAQLYNISTQLNTLLTRLSAPAGVTGEAEHVPKIVRRRDDDHFEEAGEPAARQPEGQGHSDANQRPEAAGKRSDNGPASKVALGGENPSACYVREGVIKIMRGRYELIDEAEVRESTKNSPIVYMYPACGSRPGSLTAFHLYLRTVKQQPKNSATAADVSNWIKNCELSERVNEKVAQLSDSQLISARSWHWQHIRVHGRENGKRQYEEMVTAEKRYAQGIFGRTHGADGEAPSEKEPDEVQEKEGLRHNETGKGSAWRDNGDGFSRYLTSRNMGIAILVAASIFAATLYYLILRDTRQQGTANTNTNASINANPGPRPAPRPGGGKLSLSLGADGHTLYLVDEAGTPRPLNLFVEPADGGQFAGHIPEVSADDVPSLLSSMNETFKDAGLRPAASITAPKDTVLHKVEAADEKGDERCKKFIDRVNTKLPRGVTTSPEKLKSLNPGLACTRLKAGEYLVVNSTPLERQQ